MRKLLAAAILFLSFSMVLASDPAGSDNEIQYSISGAHAAEAGFEYNPTTNTLTCEILDQPAAASPIILLKDSTLGGETQISMTDAAGPDGIMAIEVDIAGTLVTFFTVDGSLESVDFVYPVRLYDGDSHHIEFDVADLSSDVTATFPASTGTVALTTSNVATATALAANGANCSAGEVPAGVDASGAVELCDATPAIDCTDCTNIPAAADLNDITNVTLTTPSDGGVLCFTGTSNNSVDCTPGGDITATEDTGTLTVAIAADAVALTTDTTGNYVASVTNGTGITGGDGGSEGAALTLAATLGTDIVTGEIVDGTILEVDLNESSGTPTDNDLLTYNAAGGNFTWISSTTDTMYMPAMYWSSDGTNCSDPAEETINSGPKKFTITCTDSDSSVITADARLRGCYTGGTFVVTMEVVSLNATPSGDYDIDIAAMCRGNSDVIDNTYGTEIAADVDFDAAGTCGGSACVQYESAMVTTAAITGNGTCANGDQLYLKGSLDATGTTATVADVRILGFTVEYACSVAGD
jgi:hypothetical protein